MSSQDLRITIKKRLSFISEAVEIAIESISRKYMLYHITSNSRLYIVFLEANPNTIPSNLVVSENNQQHNTGKFYR